MIKKPRYTDKQKQKALALYKEGYSSREAGKRSGVGFRTVIRFVKKMGASREKEPYAPKTLHKFGKDTPNWKGGIFDPTRRKYHLKARYNMTLEEYERLVEEQGGVCAICGNFPVGRHLSVDHDHKTGKVRGLLCVSCNNNVGVFENWKEQISNYIKKGK